MLDFKPELCAYTQHTLDILSQQSTGDSLTKLIFEFF